MTENASQITFRLPKSQHKIWLLRLVLPIKGPIGKVLTATLIFAVTWGGLELTQGELQFYEQLFFSALIAYSVVILSRIVEQSELAVDELQKYTEIPAKQLDAIRAYMSHNSRRELLYSLAGALFFGSIHILLIRTSTGDSLSDIIFNSKHYPTHLGTLASWVVLTTVISSLINNALVWARLGNALKINLLQPRATNVIGRVAVLSTLSMIGAQVLFVLLVLDTGFDWVSVFPGLAAGFVPTMALFFIPVWPLQTRLRASKAAALEDIEGHIKALGNLAELPLDDTTAIDRMNQLLQLRREVQLVSVWPYDSSNLFKFAFYLLLPPLTWVGAALVENVVETFVD